MLPRSITTLYVGGVGTDITEDDLRDAFYSHGELTSVRKVESRFCAFVNFANRAGAERAAEELHNKLIIKGTKLRLMWGRPQQGRPAGGDSSAGGAREPDPMQPVYAWKPPGAGGQQQQQGGPMGAFTGPPPGVPVYYPSMDPTQMGAVPKRPGGEVEEGEGSKRQRTDASSSGAGSGFGFQGPPPMPAPYGMPPPMGPPPGHMRPPAMGHMRPPPGMGPPPGAPPPPRPPAGAPPPAAAAAGSIPGPRPPAGPAPQQ